MTDLLDATNIALGGALALLVLAVLGGVVYELATRRRMRAPLPDTWPPGSAPPHPEGDAP